MMMSNCQYGYKNIYIYIYIIPFGGVHHGVSKMVGLQWNIPLKWRIGGFLSKQNEDVRNRDFDQATWGLKLFKYGATRNGRSNIVV